MSRRQEHFITQGAVRHDYLDTACYADHLTGIWKPLFLHVEMPDDIQRCWAQLLSSFSGGQSKQGGQLSIPLLLFSWTASYLRHSNPTGFSSAG